MKWLRKIEERRKNNDLRFTSTVIFMSFLKQILLMAKESGRKPRAFKKRGKCKTFDGSKVLSKTLYVIRFAKSAKG